jgi:hypothetical protein
MSDMSDDVPSSDVRLPNGQFAKGNPGGPGRPRAADRVREFDRRVAEAGPDLIEALLRVAMTGNVRAIEMALDRVWPVRRGRPVAVIDAPEIGKTADLLPVGAAITNAVLNGELTPQEGADTARVLTAHADMIEATDFEQRLAELEKAVRARRGAP